MILRLRPEICFGRRGEDMIVTHLTEMVIGGMPPSITNGRVTC